MAYQLKDIIKKTIADPAAFTALTEKAKAALK